jgi:serine/threonine protein phosphatase PrpC
MTLALRYAVRSDVGLLREGNEDSAYAGPHLLAIADGMGGHAAGEVASSVAISAIAGLDTFPVDHPLEALAAAVSSASAAMHEINIEDPSTSGMGTTLTALLWDGTSVAICHIGDSRAYLLRDGELHQITHDHTLVQSLVDDGKLTPAEAINHPNKSLVMRALQSGTDAQPDLSRLEAQAGDRYLLCSDGLSDVVTSEETLRDTLIRRTNRNEAVQELIQLALRGGGPDNITCIVADVVNDGEDGAGPAAEPVMVVGAASNGDGRPPQPLGDSPAERAHLIARAGMASTGTAVSQQTAGEEEQDQAETGAGAARRRWPLVTSILVVLLIVIVGGAYAAWRYTQSQYYVGTDGRQVIIYRGVNQKVLGVNLSSAYQRTGIPLAQVPSSDQQAVRTTITSSSLADAQKTVGTIRQAYQCQKYQGAYASWLAHKPKPQTVTVTVDGKKVTQTITPPYPAAPKMPTGGCAAQGASG